MRLIHTMAPLALAIGTTAFAQATGEITEVRTGGDPNEYVEIRGIPGQSLAGLTLLVIGDGSTTGTAPTRSGVVEWKYTFAAGDVFGPNGYLVLRNPLMAAFTVNSQATDLQWSPTSPDSGSTTTGFEGGDNQTYILVRDYTGTSTFQGRAPNAGGNAGAEDLDTNDDGTLDVTPWSAVVDRVCYKETNGNTPGAGEVWWYGSPTVGPYVSRTIVTATAGTTIAGWDFQTTSNENQGTAAAGAPNSPKLFRSNAGYGVMYLDGTNGSSDWVAAPPTTTPVTNPELNAFTGTNLNATGTGTGGNGLDPATSATSCLAIAGGGQSGSVPSANGKSVVFKFSMANFAGLNVSYATRTSGTTTGFTTHQWAYSTDGVNWTDAEAVTGLTTSFVVKSLAPISALNAAQTAYLRLTVSGATSVTSNNRLDNVLFFSNPVTSDTIVITYGAPIHVYKQPSGTWAIGGASTTTGFSDTPGADNPSQATYSCGGSGAGDCGIAHDNPYCADSCCCAYVCGLDPWCCATRWDSICVGLAANCAANCGGGTCAADFNQDNLVNGADLSALLGGWNGPDYDLTGDGVTNGADLSQLLGSWGSCN